MAFETAPFSTLRYAAPPFIPPWWLRGGHAQTLVASQARRRWDYGWDTWQPLLIALGTEGFLLAEASWQRGDRCRFPALLLLHGLEGSARSHYLIGMSRKAYVEGFHAIRVNTRNCGGTEHLTSTLYCAGLSQDVLAAANHLKGMGIEEIYAAAVSLGGNILLKFLGELGEDACRFIRGAAVISPPIDLDAGARRMEEPGNRIYQRYFVGKLIARMRRKTALFPHLGDMSRIARIRTIREFDHVVTAPHFGFGTAENYYRLASSAPLLGNIRVPTLIIQAKDDPLIPFGAFAVCALEENPMLHLLAPEAGGHTGFIAARPSSPRDRDRYWAESRAVDFIKSIREPAGPIRG